MLNSEAKNIFHYCKRAQTCHLFCKRPGCDRSDSNTHARDKIFKLRPIHASVIYQVPKLAEFTEFNDSSAPFRTNSNV